MAPSGMYFTARELCASRLTQCSNRPIYLRQLVLATAKKRKGETP
jgi:hypothetical protein